MAQQKKCKSRGCQRDAVAKRMCMMHYTREYRKSEDKRIAAVEASRRWRERTKATSTRRGSARNHRSRARASASR